MRAAAVFLAGALLAQAQSKAPEWAERLVHEVRSSSFPELLDRDIRVRQFAGSSDYFQARFGIWRFLTLSRMHYVIRVNSAAALISGPEEGKRAIIAHELAHVAYSANGNRLRLLGLIRLASPGFRERFEKRADVEALRRGYAQGLRQYRIWLYQHVSAGVLNEKRRDYLTPEEIDAIQRQIGR
ncbi:MAG TPA: hypothetical protein VKE70_12325 [Candidatus Solibacter sp.]|nr:hypothetical protein [Candidatus Solibacter sp.]